MSDAAYQALLHQRLNQAIVISGESGAGKTESANLLLKQLVYLSKAPNRRYKCDAELNSTIRQMIILNGHPRL